jgi:hypothetical protein
VPLDLREGDRRVVKLLGDLHFWIPLAALAGGVALLRWLA